MTHLVLLFTERNTLTADANVLSFEPAAQTDKNADNKADKMLEPCEMYFYKIRPFGAVSNTVKRVKFSRPF